MIFVRRALTLQSVGTWLCPFADFCSPDVCGGGGAVDAPAYFMDNGTDVGATACDYGC